MPAPRVEDFREKMRCASYYLKTDMAKGYWQIPLSEKTKNLCILSTHLGPIRPNESEKTFIGLEELSFHGFVFNQFGIKPDPEKGRALKEAQ